MACNSIVPSMSSSQMIRKYDVFVSFRGTDTRNNFTDHLFAALDRKGILTFRDDKKLEKGEAIGPELFHAIEGSLVFIVVFSKDYAFSTWCLRELAKIVDCLDVSSTKHVLPIFYDVDPSEVRKQSGNYEKAFVEHEKRFKQDLNKLQTWKAALTQVANLSGWDVRDKPQSEEIAKIVEKTISLLDYKFFSVPNDIVGWQSHVEELEKLLFLGSDDDVRVLGICGMGGIGKTTLTTILYDKICHRYDACCFIDDVSKIYRKHGLIGAQKQLLFQTLKDDALHIYNPSQATNLIRTRLCRMKALIVLDNIDKVEQLEKLTVERAWLVAGSRIIVISRDQHILKDYKVDVVYKVQLLNHQNALQLFCRKAFKCDDFKSDYEKLTCDVLEYAGGLPLAIKVLGSHLYGGNVSQWRSALTRLREHGKTDIMDVLRISYNGLEGTEKDLFLDIACFFDGKEEIEVMEMLDFRGFHPDIGIRVLEEKSLITREYEMIRMHDLLKELGRSIVRQESPKEPRKWSRVWDYEDLHNVMLENKASENLKAIVLNEYLEDLEEIPEETLEKTTRADALSQMSHLNLLILWNVEFLGSLSYLSNELGYLSWDEYPFTCLPSSFEPDKLVKLILPYSNIEQLWEGTKSLYNLRHMDLSHSKNLIKIPDFREAPNLERLNLQGCIKLQWINPSIGLLEKLVLVNLADCENIVSVPINILGISSLEKLDLSRCSKLQMFDETGIDWQSTSSSCKMLVPNYPKRHEERVGLLLSSLPNFPCMRWLYLTYCNLLQIPDCIGSLHYLESLNLEGNNFVALPSSIKKLSKLTHLNLMNCKQLKYLPQLPSITVTTAKKELYIFNCPNLRDFEHYYRMAFNWMIQVIELLMQSRFNYSDINIIIPGSQIPRWFNKQSVGNTIRMDASPIMHDNNNWIGVACCVKFVAHHDPSYLRYSTMRESGIWIKFGGKSTLMHPIHCEKDAVTVESDHLFLRFLGRWHFDQLHGGPHDFDGIVMEVGTKESHCLHLEVKNCGYRWIFKDDKDDLQQINTTMLHSINSSFLKRKFLRIDDEPHP